jgi:hypothetical protein
MNRKKIILFQDNDRDGFIGLEDRLTALLFDKDMAAKALEVICEEDEYGENIYDFKTMNDIKEHLAQSGIKYEEIDMSFFDYNLDEESK